MILLVAMVLFGGSKLPDLARSPGRSVQEFRKGVRDAAAEEPRGGERPNG